jgi:SAM-dependent MidA family methyltransferase
MSLREIIIEKIKKEGPISFRDFMEMALYYPGLGYYTSSQNIIGKQGDYFTGSSLGPVFGAMIARQTEQMWEITGKKNFTIVEYGAGTGALCHDILDYLKNNKEFYEGINYCIIEKSPVMREKEKAHLPGKVSWYNSIKELPSITGCVLSNEVADNFAFHRVEMGEELMEVYVDYKDGFAELLRPAPQILRDYFAELNVTLPQGYRTEINLEATQWISDIASVLKQGYVLTIDYGYLSEDLYNERRKEGTMMCYHRHTLNNNPYIHIGEQDITAHINFSALIHWGAKCGLHYRRLTNQSNFLLSLGFNDYLRNTGVSTGQMAAKAMQASFLTHTLLSEMGRKFKVLVQSKGVRDKALTGLKL